MGFFTATSYTGRGFAVFADCWFRLVCLLFRGFWLFGGFYIFAAIAPAEFGVAFLVGLKTFTIRFLALSIFAETATDGYGYFGGSHDLVFDLDAVETAVADQAHVVGLAGADAVVL